MVKILFLFLLINFLVVSGVVFFCKRYIYTFSFTPNADYVLTLGAGINKNGLPSKILEDRLISTVNYTNIYQPNQIILSGTKRKETYDEPLSMQHFLLKNGIDPKLIFSDAFGTSTFQSCINFKKTYGTQRLIIVSQKFHLYRSIMISRLIGLDSFGLIADNHSFNKTKVFLWYLREFCAIPYNIIKLFLYLF